MPDQSIPSSTPNAQATPEELNLSETGIDRPRLKRRSLKGRTTTTEPVRPSLDEKEPLPDSPRADYPRPDQPRVAPAPVAATAIPAAKPAGGNPFVASAVNAAPSAQSLPTTPLYYTTGVRKDKEPASPMKSSSPASSISSNSPVSAAPASTSAPTQARAASTPSSAASGSTSTAASTTRPSQASAAASAASSYQSRPAAAPTQARPASTGATPSSSATAFSSTPSVAGPARSASANDYRANVERQSREQKSVGGMIAMIVYALAGFFVLATLLAIYGAVTITKQMHQQSLTMSDLDSRYSAENQALTTQLKASNDSLTEALTQTQAQLKREQDLVNRQQDLLNKLSATGDVTIATLRQERQARVAEEASLRAHIRNLEAEPRATSANR